MLTIPKTDSAKSRKSGMPWFILAVMLVTIQFAGGIAPGQQPAATVRAISAPATPLPPEAQSAGVTRFSFIDYGDTRADADGTAPQQRRGVIVQGGQIDAFENHATAIGCIEAREQIEQRRLADAGLAHDGQVLAAAKFEIDALEDRRPILREAFA